jgi:signal transduction histidine kinase
MRRRIVLLVVGMTTLVILAFSVPVGILLHSALAQHAEQAAIDQANSVALFLSSGEPTSAEITSYVDSLNASSGRPTTVVAPDGTSYGATANVPGGAHLGGGPDGGGPPGGGGSAVLHSVPGGQVAETVVPAAGGGAYAVRVYLPDSALRAGEGKWLALLICGSVALLLLSWLLGELITRRIVRPLNRTASAARRLAHGDKSARAPTDGPREVADVGRALNQLATRIDELITEERETVADLSHRLRTPLTALRLDAEGLRNPDEAERIGTQVGVVERMLTGIIHTARRAEREGMVPSCDATAVVRERVAFWSALAEEQQRAGTLHIPQTPLLVRASAEDLAAAIDALLENVFAYTPEATPYAVRVTTLPDAVLVEVEDDGPGLSPDMAIRGRSDRGSTGLGLDIARRTAEVSGGGMNIGRARNGGAIVSLRLGFAAS